MTRVIIRLNDDSVINIVADCIDARDTWIMAWDGESLVAIVNSAEVKFCYLSEQKG